MGINFNWKILHMVWKYFCTSSVLYRDSVNFLENFPSKGNEGSFLNSIIGFNISNIWK